MRGAGLCTVSGPLAACSTASGAPLPAGARFLALHLLAPPTPASRECSTTQQTLYFIVEVKSRVKEVYAQTCLHFSQQGMVDTDLFGLAIICDGEYLFAEPESKLSKYAPKSWRSSHTHGLDANGRPALAFYFRVQFFVDSPLLLRDESTRHHYYLQLRHNAATRGSEQAIVLAGLALQADYGDRVDSTSPGYFRPEDYVPPSLRTPWGVQAIENNHRDNRGLSKPEAELQYVREACNLQEPINAHVFRLRGNKNESLPGSITLAVCAQGIKVFPDNNPASTFLWGSIGKLSFERKKFEIRTGHEKLTLYTSSDEKSKLLLSLCRDTHQFSMAMAPRLTEAKKQEEEQRRCLRDCYLYSRIPCKSGRLDQRVSVISSTSSNTTSGIVSDRVHSEDELEIMITCPPAPSTESLALAHLIDSNPVSRQSSSASAQEKLITDALKISQTDVLSNCSRSSSSSSEPISSKDITSKQTDTDSCISTKTTTKCAGSQCSSSCSTVVVATTTKTGRRPSTSSSLELGYSHTAQNSSVSDATCIEIDTRETSSGVYTLGNTNTVSSQTSGIYTMDSSEMTSNLSNGDSQNDYAGQIDQVDGTDTFRDRSNSNISNSGSFRGDGSDPTDTKQTLLSAEELSDLIVGRGVYPSRKTVSHTLDSDSDYVTLPSNYQGFAPIPPKRIDSNQVTNLNNSLLGIVGNSISSETCDSMLHFRPPPPYNAHHETISKSISTEPSVTDFDEISVSCLSDEILIPTRDPPPYPYPATVTTPIPPPVYPSEEVSARFIKTRPQINVLTAHTSTVLTPSTNYPSNSESIPKSTILQKPDVPPIPPKHASTLSKSKPHFYPSNDTLNNLKSVAALPVTALIAPNNYLDVAASKASVLVPYTFLPPPPPPPIPRQPPPPPPSNLATVYTSQLSRSQIEQYQQQMYSDVDFVVFPLKEPALSKQEYLEAKQGSLLAALAQSPPPYPLYRSTPYLNVPRYASTQNLSDTYVHLPIYSAASLSSTGSLEPPPPLPPNRTQLGRFRAKSDDNILNSLDMPQKPKFRRLPPPPPPVFSLPNDKLRRNEIKSNEITAKDILRSQQIASDISVKEKLLRSQPNLHSIETQSSIRIMKSNINLSNVNSFSSPVKRSQLNSCSMSSLVSAQLSAKKPQINNSNSNSCSMSSTAMNIPSEIPVPSSQCSKTSNSGVIDIRTLLEKSKNLDLPLISALCNDRSLLKQTKAFVMPKHPDAPVRSPSITTTKLKYPVSGLSSTQISKPVRKTVSSHRHPNDKLPEIPRAAPNTYVVTDSKGKHKTMQSHS